MSICNSERDKEEYTDPPSVCRVCLDVHTALIFLIISCLRACLHIRSTHERIHLLEHETCVSGENVLAATLLCIYASLCSVYAVRGNRW